MHTEHRAECGARGDQTHPRASQTKAGQPQTRSPQPQRRGEIRDLAERHECRAEGASQYDECGHRRCRAALAIRRRGPCDGTGEQRALRAAGAESARERNRHDLGRREDAGARGQHAERDE